MKTIYVCELRSEELMIIAVIYAAFAVAKRKPEKNSGLYGIRTLISEIPVQRSIPVKLTSPSQLGAGR